MWAFYSEKHKKYMFPCARGINGKILVSSASSPTAVLYAAGNAFVKKGEEGTSLYAVL